MLRTLAVILFALLALFATGRAARKATGDRSPLVRDLIAHQVQSSGLARDYLVYVPTGYDPNVASPVIFCFHGGGGSASGAAGRYGILEESEERNWVAVFPEGYETFLQTWNGGNCCGSAAAKNIDDVGFFDDMLAQLAVDYSIDAERVFVTGFSNGGIMSYRIGVERPNLVRAIAPVGAALETVGPSSPIPFLAIHGALDEYVPIDGGVGTGPSNTDFNSQAMSIAPFLQVNGGPAFGPPEVIGEGRLFKSLGPFGGADTWYYLALDGGHSWPGSSGLGIDPTEPVHTDVPATPLVFDFFERQFPDRDRQSYLPE